jgi:hypothetical protein
LDIEGEWGGDRNAIDEERKKADKGKQRKGKKKREGPETRLYGET